MLSGSLPGIAVRLGRAGFAVVSFESAPEGLEVVLDAFERGVLGLEADGYAVVEPLPDGAMAIVRGAGGVRLPGAIVPGVDALVRWLAQHHV